nr:FtsX-like permease family protein [Actinomycetota bacterium]
AHDVLDKFPEVESWSSAYFGSDLVDGRNVPLLGMAPGSAVLPPIVAGRAAANAGEVVLGAATASQLRKAIGDRVSVGAQSPRDLRIVGFATLPTVGIVHGAHTSLGTGAIVAPELVPGFDRNVTEAPTGGGRPDRVGPNAIFIRFRPHANVKSTFARLSQSIGPIASFPGTGMLIAAQRPAEIVNSSEVGGSPQLLAGALALGAMASLGLALATSVNRRRRDLALLKALGFTRHQIGATVAWQATATVAVGLLIGVPVGVLAGRALWELFARQLDVVPLASVPVLVLTGLVVGTVVLANLIAAVPARIASRIHPSLVLRSE